jgi:hypothetical protein
MTAEGPLTFQQFRSFEAFVKVISKLAGNPRSWNLIANELVEPISRVLVSIVNRSNSIRELMFHFNYAHRFMSLHTLTGLGDRKEVMPDHPLRTESFIFDPASFANAIFTIDATSLENVRYDNTFYHKAQSIHALLTDVGDGLAIARRYLDPTIWKTSEVLREAINFVPAHPLKEWIKEELIARRKDIPFKRFEKRAYLSDKWVAADAFYRSLGSKLLGYAPSFIYSNGDEEAVVNYSSSDRYRTLHIAKPQSQLPTLTVQDLESLMLRGKLKEYLRKNPGPIRFQIPIGLQAGPPKLEPNNPWIFSAQSKVQLKSLYIGFRDGDDEKRHNTDDEALLMPRVYTAEQTPWVDIGPDYPRLNMVHQVTAWSELELGVPLAYMPRHGRKGKHPLI